MRRGTTRDRRAADLLPEYRRDGRGRGELRAPRAWTAAPLHRRQPPAPVARPGRAAGRHAGGGAATGLRALNRPALLRPGDGAPGVGHVRGPLARDPPAARRPAGHGPAPARTDAAGAAG